MAKIGAIFQKEEIKKPLHPKRLTKWIHYSKLKTNGKQYCDAKDQEEIERLADLIQADGEVLQDLLVRKLDADEYEIIGGHKRKAACKVLVEERGLEQFAFLPCIEKNLSDVKAEFQIYSSNGHHIETPYEIMHKLERMQYLLQNFPEEFPDMQTGRMVERLAAQFSLSKSTVGEYQSISKNLSEEGMKEFQSGHLEKSAAYTLSTMEVKDQEQALSKGLRKNKDLQAYKKEKQQVPRTEIRYTQKETTFPSNRTEGLLLKKEIYKRLESGKKSFLIVKQNSYAPGNVLSLATPTPEGLTFLSVVIEDIFDSSIEEGLKDGYVLLSVYKKEQTP